MATAALHGRVADLCCEARMTSYMFVAMASFPDSTMTDVRIGKR